MERKHTNLAICLCLALLMAFSALILISDSGSEDVRATYVENNIIYYFEGGDDPCAVVDGVYDSTITSITILLK